METLVEKKTSLFAQSSQNFEGMLENLENLSLDHLDFLIRVANKSHGIYVHSEKYKGYKKYRQFIVEKVTEHIKKLEEMDEKTRYTLKHLTLTETSDGNRSQTQVGTYYSNSLESFNEEFAPLDLESSTSMTTIRPGFNEEYAPLDLDSSTSINIIRPWFNEECAPLESSTSMPIIRPGRDHYQ